MVYTPIYFVSAEHVGRERGISRRIYNRAKETRHERGTIPRPMYPRFPHLVSFKHLLSADRLVCKRPRVFACRRPITRQRMDK